MTAPRPLRADAQRNRQALLVAAREAFLAGDSEAHVEVIARRAGVSVGTLYRHFGTRDGLVEAVYRQEVDHLCDSALELLAERSPNEALRAFLLELVKHAAVGRGIAVALQSIMATESPAFNDARVAMASAIDHLLAAGGEAGTLRTDVPGRTVLRALGGICGLARVDGWQDEAAQVSMLLFDGLSTVSPA